MREPVNATDDRKAKIKKWITENILRPKAAIVLLRNNSNVARSSSAIELYDIAEGGRLNNGRPISVESLDAFIQAAQMSLNKRKKAKTYISGVIDPSILYVSQTSIAFMYPSGIRSIFIGNEKDFKEFKLFVPAMVFVYETRSSCGHTGQKQKIENCLSMEKEC
jgi:hypothetical protein